MAVLSGKSTLQRLNYVSLFFLFAEEQEVLLLVSLKEVISKAGSLFSYPVAGSDSNKMLFSKCTFFPKILATLLLLLSIFP